jgi:NhaP-type Na+/H+ or K+/H+ antiporter
LLDPDDVYGNLLFPAGSAAVAFLLFDGGLSLRFRELEDKRLSSPGCSPSACS